MSQNCADFVLCHNVYNLQAKIVEELLGYEVIQVSCGASHVLAVTNEHEVFSWGRGDNGESVYWITDISWSCPFFLLLNTCNLSVCQVGWDLGIRNPMLHPALSRSLTHSALPPYTAGWTAP